ncbi:hypothetical protein ACH4GC_41385, partial [Streptomyces zaomyceticus]
MTPSHNAAGPASEPAPLRPGRKLGPIASTVGSSHRAWLTPTRDHYLLSGRTLSDLSARVLAKSKLSELLRGVGHYCRRTDFSPQLRTDERPQLFLILVRHAGSMTT